jgi:hypothetical protein
VYPDAPAAVRPFFDSHTPFWMFDPGQHRVLDARLDVREYA